MRVAPSSTLVAAGVHRIVIAGTGSAIELLPENPDDPVIRVEPGEPFEIEGLAVGLIRNTMLM